jgi:hypothetical protein
VSVLRVLVLEAFGYAARRGLGYGDFLLALAAARGAPVPADARLTSLLRDLARLAESAPARWCVPEGAVLVDGLGLAEAYGVYRGLSAAGAPPVVDVGVNPRGDTLGFKRWMGVETMARASRELGTSTLYRSTDRLIHGLPPMPPEGLAAVLERELGERLMRIAEDARRRGAAVATDHAYDVVCEGGLCRLCHGVRCPLSRLALVLG